MTPLKGGERVTRKELIALKVELHAYKHSFSEIWWMARRYADGRMTYAPEMYNGALKRVMHVGFKPDKASEDELWAKEGKVRK